MSLVLKIVFFISNCVVLLALEGPNVCIDEREFPTQVKVPAKVPVEVSNYKWCLKIPPRCKVKEIVYREGYKEEIHNVKNKTQVCCPGYAETRNKCVPICSIPCIHGVCGAPDQCECQLGWTGVNCEQRAEIKCPPGSECERNCRCQNEGFCDPTTGTCRCKPEWKGQYCEVKCQLNDSDCNQKCRCENGGYCVNTTTGQCQCGPGFTGMFCTERCPSGTYGLNCAFSCDCEEENKISGVNAICDPAEGCKILSYASLTRNEETGFAATTLLFMLLISLLCVVILSSGFLIMKYRRKLQILNNELSFVTYVSSKDPNDRFDNPLYAYPTLEKEPKQLNLVNPGFLTNDLGSCQNNLEKTALSSGQSIFGMEHGLDALKCVSRSFIPNIYESDKPIQMDSKIEPEYEEIGGKNLKKLEKENYYDTPRPQQSETSDDNDDLKP